MAVSTMIRHIFLSFDCDKITNTFLCLLSEPNPFGNVLNNASNVNAAFAGNPINIGFPFNAFAGMPMNPPPPMPAFAFQQPPAIPPNLDQLSDEELRTLEGNERRNVEERIKVCMTHSV